MSWYSAITGRDAAKRALQAGQQYAGAAAAADASDPYGRQGLVGQENALMGQEHGYGTTATDAYLKNAQNFNAQDAVNNYAQGAWGSISQALKKNLRGEQDAATASGRLNTGFYDEDRGDIYQTATDQLSNAVAQQSVNAAGLQLRNNEGLGAFGQNATNNYADLLTARRGEVEQDYRDEEDRKRKRRSGIGAAIGAGLGSFFGPVGTAVGGGIGGAIFS